MKVEICYRLKLINRKGGEHQVPYYLTLDASNNLRPVDLRENSVNGEPPELLLSFAVEHDLCPSPADRAFWSHWLTTGDFPKTPNGGIDQSIRRLVSQRLVVKGPRVLQTNARLELLLDSPYQPDREAVLVSEAVISRLERTST